MPTILVAIASVLFLSAPTLHYPPPEADAPLAHIHPSIPDALLEREIQSLTDRGLQVKLFNGVVEATDPVSGQKWQFSTEMLIPREPRYTGLPTLTIDLRTIDTNLYNWKYHYVNSFPLSSGWGFPLQVKDFDGNGRPEAYGIYQTQADFLTQIYEQVDTGWTFIESYPIDTGLPDKSGDIDGNGLQEVYFRYRDSLFAYEQGNLNGIPNIQKFRFRQWFYGATGIPNQVYDANSDLTFDLVFQGSEPDSTNPPIGEIRKTYIARYDSGVNNLRKIWATQLPVGCIEGRCASAIAFGDLDGDSLPEFVTSAEDGGVFVVEHVEGDSFAVIWSDSIPTGRRAAVGDVDGNGIVEFFVGSSQVEPDGFAHLRAYAFERTGDNSYQPVFEINVFPVGLFFVDLYHTADVDGDEIPELVLSIGGGPLIIKGIASHNYELFYHMPFGYLDAVSVAKGGDIQAPKLFVSKHLEGQPIVKITEVFSLDSMLIVDVNIETTGNASTNLFNYPNPFNGSTTIQFTLEKREFVSLMIYDINGREITKLVNSEKEAGIHNISWNPTDAGAGKSMASGVYLYTLLIGDRAFVDKMLYVK